MISPVLYDREFVMPLYKTNQFIRLGHMKGNRGITHILFLRRSPVSDKFSVGENHFINGYCNCRYLFNTNNRLIGVVFCAFSHKCKCNSLSLSIANYGNLPSVFEPLFSLENLGILMFTAEDSSLLILPKVVNHSDLLVKDE